MMPRQRLRRRGFTLTELLVVMGIISLLAAVLYPFLQRGIQQSLSTGCISHLQRIYVGLQQYASDHNAQFPVMLPLRASVSDSGPTLDTTLTSYLPDPSVFHCPADNSLFAQSGCSYLWVYGYSVNAQGQQNSTMVAPSFPLLGQTNPSQIPFVSDKVAFHLTTPSSHIVYADGHIQ